MSTTSKKKSPLVEMNECIEAMHESRDRWNEIRNGGCNDPFWPDGTNMNLVRNHIIYFKKRIRELCEINGMIEPEEADWDLPPKVSDNLFIGDKLSKRYERISAERSLTFDVPEIYEPYREGQVSLFE